MSTTHGGSCSCDCETEASSLQRFRAGSNTRQIVEFTPQRPRHYYLVGKADAGSVPCSTTNTQNPNPHRLGFFLPVPPVLARFPGLSELQPSALMFAQVLMSIRSIIFAGRRCGLISPCESPQLCNPTHAARSGLVQPFVAAHLAAVVSLIGSAHHRRNLSAVLVLEICMRLGASRRANQGLAVIAHRRRC